MSNVIIGIMAVVMTIALAVGSSLYIGPALDRTRNENDARSHLLVMRSVVLAMERAREIEGFDAGRRPVHLLYPDYLPSLPLSPHWAAYPHEMFVRNNNAGEFVYASTPDSGVPFAMLWRMPSSASDLCDAFARLGNSTPMTVATMAQFISRAEAVQTSCVILGSTISGLGNAGERLLYIRYN